MSTSVVSRWETKPNINEKKRISIEKIVAIFLAIAPVLEPYILFEIGSGFTLRVCDPIAIVIAIVSLHKYGTNVKGERGFLLKILCVLIISTTIAAIGVNSDLNYLNAFKVLLVWGIYALLLSFIWGTPCRKQFVKYLQKVALFCAFIVFAQFLCGYAGIWFWDGRIPFLSLGKYDSWAGFVYEGFTDVRPCGIFQEPSYAGIYLMVALATTMHENKILKSFVYAFAIFATSSVLSILTCIGMITYIIVINRKLTIRTSNGRLFIFAFVGIVIVSIILYNSSEYIRTTFDYVYKRVANISTDVSGNRMGSAKIRLVGYLELFKDYPTFQKLFGVGASLFDDYFHLDSYYSNVYVASLLDYGIVGLVAIILLIISLLKKSDRDKKIFVIIFAVVIAGDYNWFNWLFYFMITACLLPEESHQKDCT